MDRKSILVLVICFILLMVWYPIINKIYPPIKRGTNLVHSTNMTLTNQGSIIQSNKTAQTPPSIRTADTAVITSSSKPKTPEKTLEITNEWGRFFFSSHGGGIKKIELLNYPELVGSDLKKVETHTNLASLNRLAPNAILSIAAENLISANDNYELSPMPQGVRAERQFTNGLTLVKEFRPITNSLLDVKVWWENKGTQSIQIPPQEWILGSATPMSEKDNNTLLLGFIVYQNQSAQYVGESWFANRTLGCLPGTPRSLYVSGTNVGWVAMHNPFFAIAAIPKEPAQQVLGRKFNLIPSIPTLDSKPNGNTQIGYETSLVYPGQVLAPNQKFERQLLFYTGPKEYNTLAKLGAQMKNELDLIMDFGGFFGFFAKALLLSMNGLNKLGLGYGMAIVAITIIIKLLFWPLTNASTRSMKRMAALQPQMKALQEKYKDDPKKMNMKLMEFMKENKVSPVSGCFPMLLQIPVFFGFYKMLQGAIELRGAHFLWAKDLSTADTIFTIPGIGFPVNPLPLLMGVTMIWQARMTPPSPGMDPMQQKIMKYMPLMFMVFLYNFSAGLTLYWTVQNLLTIAQMKLTKNVSVEVAPPRKHTTPTPGAFGSKKPKI